jgi:hypothetical protein
MARADKPKHPDSPTDDDVRNPRSRSRSDATDEVDGANSEREIPRLLLPPMNSDGVRQPKSVSGPQRRAMRRMRTVRRPVSPKGRVVD